MGNCTSNTVSVKASEIQGKLPSVPDSEFKHSSRHKQDSSGVSTPFDLAALPPDVLLHIKDMLPARSAHALLQVPNSQLRAVLHSTTHCCKLLTPHSNQPQHHKHIWFKHKANRCPFAVPKRNALLAHCSGLETIDLGSCGDALTLETMMQLLLTLPPKALANTRTLKLGTNTQHLLPTCLASFRSFLPALRNLECCLCAAAQHADSMATLLQTFTELSRLKILPAAYELEPILDSSTLQTVSRFCPAGLHLDFHSWHVTMLQLHLHPHAFANITSLQLLCNGTFMANTQGALPQLQSVRLHCKGNVTLETLSRSFLATAHKLKVLHLCGLEGTGPTAWLASLGNLEELVLSHAKFPVYSITHWHAFLSSFPALRTLVMDMCSGVPECNIYPLLSHPLTQHTSTPPLSSLQHTPFNTPSPIGPPLSHSPSPEDPTPFPSTPTSTPTSKPGTPPHPHPHPHPHPISPCSQPSLQTLCISTHWGAGAHPSFTAIHRWLYALTRLQAPLPPTYRLTSLHLHFNNTDIEADLALPHIHALTRLPHLALLHLSTSQVRCIDSKMVPTSHLQFLKSLASAPKLKTLKLQYGWLPPATFATLVSALPRLSHIAWVASPDLGSTRRYLATLDAAQEGLTASVTFVGAHRDVVHHGGPLGRLLESRRLEAATAVLLESRAAEKLIGHFLKNPALLKASVVLPRCENEAELKEMVAAPLQAAGIEVDVSFHAGCYRAWAKALGDPGVLLNAENGDWRQLGLYGGGR